tara:strand:- start:2700 stop:4442 length:1743 start_codon:yes stop_codon:yes gene_type:complete
MKLISLSSKICLLILLILKCNIVYGEEEEVDIWKNSKIKKDSKDIKTSTEINSSDSIFKTTNEVKNKQFIEENIENRENEIKVYGIYDPEDNNFKLQMWANTKPSEIKNIIKRIDKLQLSNFSKDIFIKTMLTYSYTPPQMSEEEFIDLKLNWLIKNDETTILEEYLNKNQDFHNKAKVIQYLVDRSISSAKLKDGCEKVNFIDKEIKDDYLEKFKIYCLIFQKKNNQAQLLFDILKEQKMSDDFFNDKINFLLGISNNTTTKVNDKNLLYFYLSSITIENFKFQPNKQTNKEIWEYMNAANLIKIEDIENLSKINELEQAANEDTLDKKKIFEIYKQIPFELNMLINAEDIYQTLNNVHSRALIYQKYLLSDNVENKINLLFLLKDLFKKDKLQNIYTRFLSDSLKQLDQDEIPKSYKSIVSKNILEEEEYKLGRIKYDDKIIHKSRIIRFYTEKGTSKQKSQKDLNSIYKKIKRNKNYFFSAKDLALIESLKEDGFEIPKDINFEKISKKYSIPNNLIKLVENEEIGFLALKLVEIIGEDEIQNLDPETIYFITHLLNKMKLFNFRNDFLISGLPLRV